MLKVYNINYYRNDVCRCSEFFEPWNKVFSCIRALGRTILLTGSCEIQCQLCLILELVSVFSRNLILIPRLSDWERILTLLLWHKTIWFFARRYVTARAALCAMSNSNISFPAAASSSMILTYFCNGLSNSNREEISPYSGNESTKLADPSSALVCWESFPNLC